MKILLSTIVPLLVLSQPLAAQAEPLSRRSVAISTVGVDTATDEGATRMLNRVRQAAERGCFENRNWDRYSHDYDRCRTRFVAAAVKAIDAPRLTARYQRSFRTGSERLATALVR